MTAAKMHRERQHKSAVGALPPNQLTTTVDPGADECQRIRVLIAAFSARYVLAQLLDEMFLALTRRIDCRLLVPTNYAGETPERYLFRAPCGVGKIDGIVASIHPIAHWKSISALRRAKPDLVHVFSGEGYTWAVSLVLVARLTGIPVVVTLHDPVPHPGNIIERLNSIVRRPVLALAQAVHIFSSQHLEQTRKLAAHAQLAVIAHGSLAQRFLRHQKLGVPREELVLFFGRIQRYKGIDILLRSMWALPATTRLAVAGPGVLDTEAQQMIVALGDRVEVHNRYLSDAEVAALLQRSSVVVLPYRHATQSSVPAIAAAFGRPVVASGLGHFVEEVPQLGGTLVPPDDPAALAAALRKVIATGQIVQGRPPTFDELSESFVRLYQSCMRRPQFRGDAEQGRSP